jgi:hypothetical protein
MRFFRAWIPVLTLVALVAACGDNAANRERIPDSLLVDVLVEVYTATAKAHLEGTDPELARVEAIRQFGIDTVVLNRTIDYLAENPDSAAVVYKRALDSLIVEQRELRSIPVRDSLSRIVPG